MTPPAYQHTLHLYTSLFENSATKTFIADITNMAQDWKRTIRLQGGPWLGSFRVRGPMWVMQEWINTHFGQHVEERCSGVLTWSGFIAEMDWNEDAQGDYLDVTVCGYIHVGNWLYVTAGVTGELRPHTWLTTLVGQVTSKAANPIWTAEANYMTTNNTIWVRDDQTLEQRIFDEVMRITELGDSTGNPWRFYLDAERKAHYEQISTVVRYYVRGGVKRRRSVYSMWNKVGGTYIDGANVVQTLDTATNNESILHFGTREYREYSSGLPQSAAEGKRNSFLSEYGFPWTRPIGTRPNVHLFPAGANAVFAPQWLIVPAVCRDIAYPAAITNYDGWLSDVRDFIVEEVEASARGVSLRTWQFSESDLLEAQYQYARDIEEDDYDLGD